MRWKNFAATILLVQIGSIRAMEAPSNTKQSLQLGACSINAPIDGEVEWKLTRSDSPRLLNFTGKLLKGKPRYIRDVWIQFRCFDSSDARELQDRSGIKWNGEMWVNGAPPDDPRIPSRIKFISLQGKNWNGGGIAMDQTAIDPPELAARDFLFCMVHPPVALCGTAHDLQRVHSPKENALPEVIKLLQGIEFVDVPSSSSATLPSPN